MVISPSEKAVLLERLQKARETKAAKAAEAKKAKAKETSASVKEPEPEPPAPAPAPAPAPEPIPEASVVAIPEVPDLVAMSRKKPSKKKCLPVSSDEESDEEAELPPKKGKQKKHAYMKIKIYKEPKNAAAFQSLIEAVQDEEQEPEPQVSPPASASIGRSCKFDIKNKTPAQSRTLPTQQEMMRRAALEFFS